MILPRDMVVMLLAVMMSVSVVHVWCRMSSGMKSSKDELCR